MSPKFQGTQGTGELTQTQSFIWKISAEIFCWDLYRIISRRRRDFTKNLTWALCSNKHTSNTSKLTTLHVTVAWQIGGSCCSRGIGSSFDSYKFLWFSAPRGLLELLCCGCWLYFSYCWCSCNSLWWYGVSVNILWCLWCHGKCLLMSFRKQESILVMMFLLYGGLNYIMFIIK